MIQPLKRRQHNQSATLRCREVVSLISEINQAKPPFMTEQQQQRDDSACAVDLSASALPESNTNAEVFTTPLITSAETGIRFCRFWFQ